MNAWEGIVKIHERRDSPPSVISMNTIGSPSPGRGTGGSLLLIEVLWQLMGLLELPVLYARDHSSRLWILSHVVL